MLPLINVTRADDGGLAFSLDPTGVKLLTDLITKQPPPDFTLELHPAPDFVHTWPSGARGTKDGAELQQNVLEGAVTTPNGSWPVTLGHVVRHTAGRNRARVNVFLEHRPVVEFVENNYGTRMASLIRRVGSKCHVSNESQLPPNYQASEFQIMTYRSLVDGPYAAFGLAVVCDSDDHETMVRHALMRLGLL